MLLSKCFLVGFVFLHYLQFDLCDSSPDSKFPSDVIATSRGSSLRRLRGAGKLSNNGVLLRRTKQHKVLCLNKKACRISKYGSKKAIKRQKRSKRCCKNRRKLCRRKFRKRCKSDNCLIKQSRKCRKQFTKCNRRKSTNRRPGNCDIFPIRKPKNRRPFTKTPTTPKPEIKKQLNDECSTTEDCQPGLCCAWHGTHRRICKPFILKGQVCTRYFRSHKRSPEQFERCPCIDGLVCSPPGPEEKHIHHTCQVIT